MTNTTSDALINDYLNQLEPYTEIDENNNSNLPGLHAKPDLSVDEIAAATKL